jgi:hypothetical protein
VPVRVALEDVPAELVAGRTATVEDLGGKKDCFHLASALESLKYTGKSRSP